MVRQLLKKTVSKPVYDAITGSAKNLLAEYKIAAKHRKGVRSASHYASQKDLKLNLGCGKETKQGWVNIDLRLDDKAEPDLTLDLRRPLPFADQSCQIIYSEHLLEHVPYPDSAVQLVKECLRVLKPGGMFSCGVPDLEWATKCFCETDGGEFAKWYWTVWDEGDVPNLFKEPAEALNSLFRQNGEHQFLYDFPTMKKFLEHCGLENVHRREFDEKLDSEHRKLESMYVEATKPE